MVRKYNNSCDFPLSTFISLHMRADEWNQGNAVLNYSLTNEAMPDHISSTEQEVAAHLHHSTKREMEKVPDFGSGISNVSDIEH